MLFYRDKVIQKLIFVLHTLYNISMLFCFLICFLTLAYRWVFYKATSQAQHSEDYIYLGARSQKAILLILLKQKEVLVLSSIDKKRMT